MFLVLSSGKARSTSYLDSFVLKTSSSDNSIKKPSSSIIPRLFNLSSRKGVVALGGSPVAGDRAQHA